MIDLIKTTGLTGLFNRISLFSSIQQEDVFDVTLRIDEKMEGYRLAINRVMLVLKTQKLLYTGQDLRPSEFISEISQTPALLSNNEEINNIKKSYIREFNTATNNIGEGYRAVANKIMLISRAECFHNTRHDLMPYEFIEILQNNSGGKRK